LDGGCELTTSQVGTTCDVKEGIYNISAIASGLITWFKDSLHIVFEDGLVKIAAIITDKLTAKEVATEKLCIGATCVTEQELKALLDKNQINLISNYSNSPNQIPITNDQITGTASLSEEIIIEPTPEPTPKSGGEELTASDGGAPSDATEPTPE
jgi:hypothetical protein